MKKHPYFFDMRYSNFQSLLFYNNIVRLLLFIIYCEKYTCLQFSVVTFKTSINEMFFIFDISAAAFKDIPG